MPASRSARATTLAPRSCPSRPGLAMRTRMRCAGEADAIQRAVYHCGPAPMPEPERTPYRFPFPPFPSGWFRVADAGDVRPGTVRPLRYFGRDLVLTRGADGAPHLFDAHCPHLGAHLGVGGRVVDGTLQCPFHGWR